VGEKDRNEDAPRTPEEPEPNGSGEAPEMEPVSDEPPRSVTSDGEEGRLADGEVADAGELLLRFRARERYVAELHDELAAARLAADEARARMAASGTRVRDLEGSGTVCGGGCGSWKKKSGGAGGGARGRIAR
jgi:hypothetical protein